MQKRKVLWVVICGLPNHFDELPIVIKDRQKWRSFLFLFELIRVYPEEYTIFFLCCTSWLLFIPQGEFVATA
jgi:hypothetical protein